MKKVSRKVTPVRTPSPKRGADDLRPHYDFRGGIRGKYTERARGGTNIVLLDPDVAARRPDAGAVNRALRALVELADETTPKRRPRRRTA